MKEAICAVPAGFQRRRAKAKIEKSARKLGMTTITLEYAGPMIQEAAAEDYTPIFANKGTGTTPQQSPEASRNQRSRRSCQERPWRRTGSGSSGNRVALYLDAGCSGSFGPRTGRVYAGMHQGPDRKHADKIGTTVITLEVATEGIEQAKGYMADAMKTGNLKDMIANLTGSSSKTGANR